MTQATASSSSLRQVLTLAAIVAGLDQTSKWLIVFGLGYQTGEAHRILPFLDFTLLWNKGISYGLLDTSGNLGKWLLIALTILIIFGFLWMVRGPQRASIILAYGLIIGGAAGNLVDRLVHGAVVDFISLHAAGYYWYVFNVADIAITLGVAALFLDMFIGEKSDR